MANDAKDVTFELVGIYLYSIDADSFRWILTMPRRAKRSVPKYDLATIVADYMILHSRDVFCLSEDLNSAQLEPWLVENLKFHLVSAYLDSLNSDEYRKCVSTEPLSPRRFPQYDFNTIVVDHFSNRYRNDRTSVEFRSATFEESHSIFDRKSTSIKSEPKLGPGRPRKSVDTPPLRPLEREIRKLDERSIIGNYFRPRRSISSSKTLQDPIPIESFFSSKNPPTAMARGLCSPILFSDSEVDEELISIQRQIDCLLDANED